MIQIVPQMRILVARDPVGFRKGINSLCQVCRKVLDADPFTGSVFVFRNRTGTAIKVLTYDGQVFGFARNDCQRAVFGTGWIKTSWRPTSCRL